MHQNKVMNELPILASKKVCRFLPRIKAKTLSSICNVPRDKANIGNVLGIQVVCITFGTIMADNVGCE